MSTPWNIYALGIILGKLWNWAWFNKSFFDKIEMGGRFIPQPKKNAKELLLPLIKDIADIVKLSDCVDVPDDNMSVEYFSLTAPQKRFIKSLYEAHYLTRWTKIHQVCGGAVKNNEYDLTPSIHIDSDKFDRVIELGLEVKKSIIVCRYNSEVDRIAGYLLAKGKKIFVINGETENKQDVLDKAHLADDCAVIVNAACSEGWELPSCDTMIFYSYDFSLKNYIQMKGRIQRINNIRKCNYISLVVQSSVDEDIYKTIVEEKMDFQEKIYQQRDIYES